MPLAAVLLAVGGANVIAEDSDVPEVRPRELAARVRKTDFNSSEISRASSLYALKCGKCHKFYDPASYDDAAWEKWMEKMSRKSKLTPAQEKSLRDYLQAARR